MPTLPVKIARANGWIASNGQKMEREDDKLIANRGKPYQALKTHSVPPDNATPADRLNSKAAGQAKDTAGFLSDAGVVGNISAVQFTRNIHGPLPAPCEEKWGVVTIYTLPDGADTHSRFEASGAFEQWRLDNTKDWSKDSIATP